MTAKWGGVSAWELYGGTPEEWAPWYDIASRSTTQAQAELSKPVKKTEY